MNLMFHIYIHFVPAEFTFFYYFTQNVLYVVASQVQIIIPLVLYNKGSGYQNIFVPPFFGVDMQSNIIKNVEFQLHGVLLINDIQFERLHVQYLWGCIIFIIFQRKVQITDCPSVILLHLLHLFSIVTIFNLHTICS